MRGIKSLLALAVLATAGAAHAATVATFDVSDTGSSTYSGVPTTSQAYSGSGVLDDSGTLTITMSGTIDASLWVYANYGVASSTYTTTYTGTFDGSIFTATGGTSTVTACSMITAGVAGNICDKTPLDTPSDLSGVSGSVSLASGGTVNISGSSSGVVVAIADTFSNPVATPAVPVPAAAWLFGSGLLGLGGAARRRKAA